MLPLVVCGGVGNTRVIICKIFLTFNFLELGFLRFTFEQFRIRDSFGMHSKVYFYIIIKQIVSSNLNRSMFTPKNVIRTVLQHILIDVMKMHHWFGWKFWRYIMQLKCDLWHDGRLDCYGLMKMNTTHGS